MSVLIQKSKTDIHRDRNRIIIAGTGNNLCLINNFDLYLQCVGNNLALAFSDLHLPWRLKGLSGTPSLHAAVAPPDRKQ
jgi:hypothetical protein